MSEGLNKVTLIGNLGADPELRFTQNNHAALSLRLATSESYIDRNKERQTRTEWHRVTVWGKRAEALNSILHKGKQLCVEGRIETKQWDDKDGNKRYTTGIVAHNIVLLGGRDASQQQSSGQQSGAGAYDNAPESSFADDSDIPF